MNKHLDNFSLLSNLYNACMLYVIYIICYKLYSICYTLYIICYKCAGFVPTVEGGKLPREDPRKCHMSILYKRGEHEHRSKGGYFIIHLFSFKKHPTTNTTHVVVEQICRPLIAIMFIAFNG